MALNKCVSHDADFLDAICTDIMHLDNKKINYYRGGYSGFRAMLEQNQYQALFLCIVVTSACTTQTGRGGTRSPRRNWSHSR